MKARAIKGLAPASLDCFAETGSPGPADRFTASELAACALREVKQRRVVYARLVATKKMTAEAAEREIAMMLAIARRLEAEANRDPRGEGRLL